MQLVIFYHLLHHLLQGVFLPDFCYPERVAASSQKRLNISNNSGHVGLLAKNLLLCLIDYNHKND